MLAIKLLSYLNLCPGIVGRSLDFLVDRSQCVRVNGSVSDMLFSSTGSPQGCVLSPILYSLYTDDCRGPQPGRLILKLSDDMVIVCVCVCVCVCVWGGGGGGGCNKWCNKSFLKLSVRNTKVTLIDFRRKSNPAIQITINGEVFERGRVMSTWLLLSITN